MKTPPRHSGFLPAAFSLIELLVVIAVLAVLLVMVVPAWNSISRGMNLTRAGDALGDALVMARQEAGAKGRETRVVFLEQDGEMRGIQVLEVAPGPNGAILSNAISRKVWLPESIVLNEDESPLLRVENFPGFRFRANGKPVALSATNNYLTLHSRSHSGAKPDNFIILQVNPVTGRVLKYQP